MTTDNKYNVAVFAVKIQQACNTFSTVSINNIQYSQVYNQEFFRAGEVS